jgi:YD repeat-containing protein
MVFVAGCTGTATQITDAASQVRTQCVDGLGRLSDVIEPDGMMTGYTHDSLNNLTGVSAQCLTGYTCSPAGSTGQTRTFTYNALSQMLSATNPESGGVTYTYDNNGNVKSRTDGNRTNSYLYDALDRLAGKCYGSGTCTALTPPSVVYGYDQGTRTSQSFTGALSSVCYLGNSTTYTHDGFGRVLGSTQTTAGTPYTFSYTYSATDQLESMTYPSGRVVEYTLDAADQVTEVTGTPKNGTATAYASGITYTAAGDLWSLPLHNGITETHSYNSRLQQTGISAGSLLIRRSEGADQSLSTNHSPARSRCCVGQRDATAGSRAVTRAGSQRTMTPASASLVASSGITWPSTPPITSAVC